MTTATISEFHRSMASLKSTLAGVRFCVGLAAARFNSAFARCSEQECAERELAFGQREARRDRCVQAICVTTNEGRCRVVVRRLGGWS